MRGRLGRIQILISVEWQILRVLGEGVEEWVVAGVLVVEVVETKYLSSQDESKVEIPLS